jgi:hypothetical protein
MRCVLLLAATITAAITLAAQAVSPQPDQSKQNLCTVAGRVVTAAEGTPLKSVHVMLTAENPGRRDPRTYGSYSDTGGVFLLKNVAPGRYRLFAERTGFVSQQYHSSDTQGGALLGLQPRQQVNDILFRLVLAAVVTGRVADEDEEPMAGIRVMALRRPTEEEQEEESYASRQQDQLMPAGSARTDDRGQYRIFGLKPGEYYLQATESLQPSQDLPEAQDYFVREALGAEYAPVFYPGVLQRGQAETIALRPGDEAQVDFSLRHIKTVEISGRVFSPDGKPVNAIIVLQDAGVEDYFEGHNTNTDAEGKFQLKGVPPGSYILMAYQQASDEVYYPTARQELSVGNDNIESLTIALSRGTDFTGKVAMEGLTRPNYIRVSLHAVGGKDLGYYGGRVKPDGSFDLKGVPEGNYAIQVYGEDESRWYVKSARLGSDDVLEHGLEVEKGTGGTLEIVISAARTQMEGSVMQDDKPAVGARVRIVAEPENSLQPHTAARHHHGPEWAICPARRCPREISRDRPLAGRLRRRGRQG